MFSSFISNKTVLYQYKYHSGFVSVKLYINLFKTSIWAIISFNK